MSMENMRPKYECPECKDSGFILFINPNGYDYARECKCRKVKMAKKRLELSGLAKEFQTKSFDNFCPGDNHVLMDAKLTVKSFADHFSEFKDNRCNSLLLCGQVGAGKTHLGTACSKQLIDNGIAVIYMGYREVMTGLKTKLLDTEAYNVEVNHYKEAEVLFIDDYLKGKITETDINILYEIINYRYNNNLPIILSTEKTLDGLINFDEAIGSRLIEMSRGHIIVFEGKQLNYRLYGGMS